MQTFLPYADIERSATVLDYRRLGKQRVEVFQILNVLLGNRQAGGWINHPAVKMWAGHTRLLARYGQAMVDEWVRRGYRNTMSFDTTGDDVSTPWWFGDERLHSSHRSNLLRKDPIYYGQFGWTESTDIPYFWPTKV